MVMPLSVLAERLQVAPPSIAALIELLENSEWVHDFLELVREFLPEHEREIMVLNLEGRMERFYHLFQERYFPLAETPFMDFEGYEYVTRSIPTVVLGIGYTQYHDEWQDMRDSFVLLLSLVAYPWYDRDQEAAGFKVSLLEEVANKVGKEIADRIPVEGWETKELHRLLDNTRFEGVACFADYVSHDTDTYFMDADQEDNYEEIWWSRENVDALTQEWQKARVLIDKLNHIYDWIEDNPQANFGEIVVFLTGNSENRIPKEQLPLPLEEKKPKTLMEVFSQEVQFAGGMAEEGEIEEFLSELQEEEDE